MTFDIRLLPVTPSLSKLSSLTAPSGASIGYLNSLNKAAALRWLLPNQGGAGGPVITARLGRAGVDREVVGAAGVVDGHRGWARERGGQSGVT